MDLGEPFNIPYHTCNLLHPSFTACIRIEYCWLGEGNANGGCDPMDCYLFNVLDDITIYVGYHTFEVRGMCILM